MVEKKKIKNKKYDNHSQTTPLKSSCFSKIFSLWNPFDLPSGPPPSTKNAEAL
jgi:hypothetical protein